MYLAETRLWWYKILHEKVYEAIRNYSQNKNLKILDAGCGTGGMLNFLQKNNLKNTIGFDYSEAAVTFCKERSLQVFYADISKIETLNLDKFDIIICNDVLYQFENEVIIKIFKQFERILQPNGLIITNNQAFNLFGGIHDIAVGSKQRFTYPKINKLVVEASDKLSISNYYYWSILLSPLILGVRLFQKLKIYLGIVNLATVNSDVEIPPNFFNNLFYKIVKFEEKFIKKPVFGSSIFLEIKLKA